MMDFLKRTVSKSKPVFKVSPPVRIPFRARRRRWIIAGLLVLLLLLAVLPAAAGAFLFFQIQKFQALGSELKAAVDRQDLPQIESSLAAVDSELGKTEAALSSMFALRLVPGVGDYYRDGTHALQAVRLAVDTGAEVVSVLEPYQEALGLGSGFGDQITVEQRLGNLLDTLPSLADKLDLVWKNIPLIQNEMAEINPLRYPEDFRGAKIRFWLSEGQKVLDEIEPLVLRGREILEVAPALLGAPKRTYLVLFQNAAELRPTGGFITGFSLLTVDEGRVLANDFHSGAYFATHYPPELGYSPPKPLGKYLNVGKWHFQDSNYWPDFPTTAQTITGVWAKSKLPKISGVVAINTDIAADLLNLTGPVKIPGYDLDLANFNLPKDCRGGGRNFTSGNLICRLEYYVEKVAKGKGTEARKVILDLISDAVIKKISTASAEIWPRLVDFIFKHLQQKNLMIYAPAEKEQALIAGLGYAGEVRESAGDYLYVNDSNFGGLKTNLYMTEEIEQSLSKLEDGTWRKTLKLKYYNPEPYDGWLSGYYKDFVRIYVPQGSKLVSVAGASQIWTYANDWSTTIQNPAGWKENGRTVFGAYFTLAPQKEHVLTFVYDLPSSVAKAMEDASGYQLLLQKQSGTNIGLAKVQIGDTLKSVDLTADQEITISLER
ncbi:MAG: DUF4012 domain-containing protein [Patescibacteria group bacterium]